MLLTVALVIGALIAIAIMANKNQAKGQDASPHTPQAMSDGHKPQPDAAPDRATWQMTLPDTPLGRSLAAAFVRFAESRIRIVDQLNPPASDDEIAEFEKDLGLIMPEEMRALYKIANGQKSPFLVTYVDGGPNKIELPLTLPEGHFVGNLFGNYEFLTLGDAKKEWDNWRVIIEQSSQEELDDFDDHVSADTNGGVRKQYANLKWIPIAKDGGGNAYAIDLDPTDQGNIGQIIVIGPDEDHRRVLAPTLADLFARIGGKAIELDDGDDQRFYFDIEE
ncbi:SMI1/KNR4 family protein [Sphingorhabdus arenilitoris]|uniref:SMI1/KNR4 family protein n=1 Tax=Sphingorhabdus arenilitoris TaxID=1490041 RepID=A0ABV8RCY6_9SPHN